MDNIDLTFTEEVMEYIVDKAIEFKLGARGLRSICEAIMLDQCSKCLRLRQMSFQ